jgi:hypothetical protein
MTDEEMISYPDLEPFFVGIVEQCGRPPIRCYDLVQVLGRYMRDGMTFDEAVDHFEFNVRGTWVGDSTPCFLRKPNELEQWDDEPNL